VQAALEVVVAVVVGLLGPPKHEVGVSIFFPAHGRGQGIGAAVEIIPTRRRSVFKKKKERNIFLYLKMIFLH